MVPRWPCSLENAGPASLSPRPAWGGIPKEKTKSKTLRRLQPYQRVRQENRRRRRNTFTRTKKRSTSHPCHRPLPDSKTDMPVPTIQEYLIKVTKRRDKHINLQDREERDHKRAKRLVPQDPKTPLKNRKTSSQRQDPH